MTTLNRPRTSCEARHHDRAHPNPSPSVKRACEAHATTFCPRCGIFGVYLRAMAPNLVGRSLCRRRTSPKKTARCRPLPARFRSRGCQPASKVVISRRIYVPIREFEYWSNFTDGTRDLRFTRVPRGSPGPRAGEEARALHFTGGRAAPRSPRTLPRVNPPRSARSGTERDAEWR